MKEGLDEGCRVVQSWNLSKPLLYNYQVADVKMMLHLEHSKNFLGGINANDMGLGKTGRQ